VAGWTILSDISLDTHSVDVMPRVAIVLEVLIVAMMLSLSLLTSLTCRLHGLRVIELEDVRDGVRHCGPFHRFT